MAYVLLPEERETHIYYDEQNDECQITTFSKKLQRKLKKFQNEFPDLIKITLETDDGEMWFELPKSSLNLTFKNPSKKRKSRELTPEEKAKLAERLKRGRANKKG